MEGSSALEIDVERLTARLRGEGSSPRRCEEVVYGEIAGPLNLHVEEDEYTVYTGGRRDALYSMIIVAYMPGGALAGSRAAEVAGRLAARAWSMHTGGRVLGVVLSDEILFVRLGDAPGSWWASRPQPLERHAILRLALSMRGLVKRGLAAGKLIEDFGCRSRIAGEALSELQDRLARPRNREVEKRYREWLESNRRVHGRLPGEGRVDGILLYSIQTYYAFILKLFAAEAAYLYKPKGPLKSYMEVLLESYEKGTSEFKEALLEVESGALFKKLLGASNYPGTSMFSWYLEELDEGLARILAGIAEVVAGYEASTLLLEPHLAGDPLGRLYQDLVPREARRSLGEYYTPEWLVELVLDESGLTPDWMEAQAEARGDPRAPLQVKILDPACGSGAFLVAAARRLREYAERRGLLDALAGVATGAVVGLDVNPLAALTAKTSYLLAMGDLFASTRHPKEIPVYVADALAWEPGERYDYVVGNPPWINWGDLPPEYRSTLKTLWSRYGLKGAARGRLGETRRDLSMLFLAKSIDAYLEGDGRLALLVPSTIYKSQAGEGVRRFLAGNADIRRVHDLSELKPFTYASNWASVIVAGKGSTRFPVTCLVWRRTGKARLPGTAKLEDVMRATRRLELIIAPLNPGDPGSPWAAATREAYRVLLKIAGGPSEYKAHEGVNTALNQVYWVEVLGGEGGGVRVRNPRRPRQRKTVEAIEAVVERGLVYPLLRGRDVSRWRAEPRGYIIVPHDPATGKPIPEGELMALYPLTYEYLSRHRAALEERSLRRLWGRGDPFYSLYAVGAYTFTPYKVVWRYIASGGHGRAVLHAAVAGPGGDEYTGIKPVIPNEKLVMVPVEGPWEAYYLAGILNSAPLQLLAASALLETAISTHLLEKVRVPKYAPGDPLHAKLSSLAEEAHKAVKANSMEGLSVIEEEIDEAVAEVYGLTRGELIEAKRMLRDLRGERLRGS